jgi:hypothetical protein
VSRSAVRTCWLYGRGMREVKDQPSAHIGSHPHLPRAGSSWIAVALPSPSVVHAARSPLPLTVRLIVGYTAQG